MKCLTIIEPYASLILLPHSHANHKRIENRSRRSNHRGLLLIHAGASRRYQGERCEEIAVYYDLNPDRLVFGAIIGIARMVDCVNIDQRKNVHDFGDRRKVPDWAVEKYPWMLHHKHTEGPFCYVLENPRRFDKPILYKGERGVFEVSLGQDAVAAQLTPQELKEYANERQ